MDIKAIRQQLYLHPQLSGQEQYAHDLIVEVFQTLHPSQVWTRVGGWGVVALWHTGADDTIALRADTDALPIGHRCGHDGHTAILLGVAGWIDEHIGQLGKNVMLIWQPEEETGRGAQKVLEANILQQYNVSSIYGLHNLPGYEEGVVVLNYNTFAAASVGVTYKFVGRATHASTPEMGINPGLAVAEMIQRFDAFNNNGGTLDAFRQSTLIHIAAGETAFGTAAADASVSFTLRAFTNKTMDSLIHEADTVAAEVSEKYGLTLSVSRCDPFRATENTPELVAQVEQSLALRNVSVLVESKPFRWSEDFSNYLAFYPGCFMGIGAGVDHPELHHPDFHFPDAIIDKAVALFTAIIEM